MIDDTNLLGARTMTRLMTRVVGVTLLLSLAMSSAWAGSDGRKGTNGANELLIPVGPRGSALGDAVSSDVSGAEALYWNPAGLANLDGSEALFSHTNYFADMKVNYMAAAVKAGNLGNLGFSAKVLSVGDVIITTEAAPDGTGEIATPTFTVLGVSWARSFTDRVSFGATTNFVSENVLSMHASGMAFDFGVQYDTGWRGLKLGMTMKNLGPSMRYDGDNLDVSTQIPGSDPTASPRPLRFTTAAFEMPSYFSLSAITNVYHEGGGRLNLMGSFDNNNFVGDRFTAAAEWNYKQIASLRASWFGTMKSTFDVDGNESVKLSGGDDLYSGLAIGAGMTVPAGGLKVGVDLSYRPVRNFFSDILEFGVHAKF